MSVRDTGDRPSISIVALATAETLDLRLRVLRVGVATTDPSYADDDAPTTFHLGARSPGGELVGTSTWMIDPADPTVGRLRGMAVDQSVQGSGIGELLVAAGLDRLRHAGVGLVWATARETVTGFYLRCGFAVVGEQFIDEATQLPHHRIELRLG